MDVMFFAKLREDIGVGHCSVSFAELGLEGLQSVDQIIQALLANAHLGHFDGMDLQVLDALYAAALKSNTGPQARPKLLASVDQCLADDFFLACINNDSEIAFFPPVSGG